jgi:hypothetical protein
VLAGLGYGAQEIAALLESGAAAAGPAAELDPPTPFLS